MGGMAKAAIFLTAAACATALAGCAPAERGPALLAAKAGAGEDGRFEDLAMVLAGAVDARGRIDPTALAVHMPRLERQLGRLAGPWPVEARPPGSETRLAWLYNARAAWSLRIVARELTAAGLRGDRFVLPATIGRRRLMDSPFPLDGGLATLAGIDRELADDDDFRVVVSAPGATDFAGRTPRAPFSAATVRRAVERRFNEYVCDEQRIVLDHAGRRLCAPPALYRAAGMIIASYEHRYRTRGATLATALGPCLDDRGRRRMGEALGYSTSVRRGAAGIVAIELDESRRGRIRLPE